MGRSLSLNGLEWLDCLRRGSMIQSTYNSPCPGIITVFKASDGRLCVCISACLSSPSSPHPLPLLTTTTTTHYPPQSPPPPPPSYISTYIEASWSGFDPLSLSPSFESYSLHLPTYLPTYRLLTYPHARREKKRKDLLRYLG